MAVQTEERKRIMFVVELDFSVDDEDVKAGSCLYLISTHDAQDAAKQAVHQLKTEIENGHLPGIRQVYVVALVEIMEEPQTPLLVRLKSETAPIIKKLTQILPGPRQRCARSWKEDGKKLGKQLGDETGQIKPILDLTE
jgi:hypothetical protein